MPQNFTENVANAIEQAFKDAKNRRNPEISENHLLLPSSAIPRGTLPLFFAALISIYPL